MSPFREELARLVQELPEDQVPAVLADVKRRLEPEADGEWPPAWFGVMSSGRHDTARRVDEILAEGFGSS
ncbi:MAG: hypothetical protein ACT4QF_21495 [Sporichthyaceae bacterium]